MINTHNIAKIIGGTTALYSTVSVASIANNIYKSSFPAQAFQNNITPLIHTSLGLSLGGLGAVLGDLSLSVGGGLQIASQQIAGQYFAHTNKIREEKRSNAAKLMSASLYTRGCCAYINSDRDDIDEQVRASIVRKLSDARLKAYLATLTDTKDKEAAQKLFSKLDMSSMAKSEAYDKNPKLNDADKQLYAKILKQFPNKALSFEMTDKERKLFKEFAAPQFTYSDKPIPYSGKICDIFELSDIGKKTAPKDIILPTQIDGDISNKYGRFLRKDEVITGNSTNDDGQNNEKSFKVDDDIPANIRIIGDKKYMIRIQPDENNTGEAVYENKMMSAMEQKPDKFEWDLPTAFAAISLTALLGVIAIGTPVINHKQKIGLLASLTKATKWGAKIAEVFMPCAINAANIRGHIAYYLEQKKNIIIKNEHLLENLSKMNISKDNDDYHFLIDFNGTLTKGSEFVALRSHNGAITDNTTLNDIIKQMIRLGEVGNKSHHIHKALKNKFPNITVEDTDKGNIHHIDGQGIYQLTKDKHYAIGNESLMNTVIDEIAKTKEKDNKNYKTKMLHKFKRLKNKDTNKKTHSVTYIMIHDNFYALDTEPKLRDDAKKFLNEHEGRFTVLTGATLPNKIKDALELNEKNCCEGLKPEDKKTHAETLTIKGKKMPKEKIVAFGDGGNDWGMFHTVNVATQLGDSSSDKTLNFADVFSDVVIPELSDFEILNNIAKSGMKSHKNLRNWGIGVMVLGGAMSLLNVHRHNPLLHVVHHLGTQLMFDALAHRFSDDIVNRHTLSGVNQNSKQ